ncbi:hypothetical protein [Paenibacillus sp. TC-CSREp1]|uniref:hypothetical protein n=1 Tax=Paenibacillus sp. TC-CSREp1 TaxID=3410089 RepID=UPI003D059088
MRERLRSVEGYTLSCRRMIEPESVFGQIKKKSGILRIPTSCLQKEASRPGVFALPTICSKKREWRKNANGTSR